MQQRLPFTLHRRLHRRSRVVAGALVSAVAVAAFAVADTTSPVRAATPPTPTYGTATVDGNPSEWDATVGGADWYAPMYLAGDPSKSVLANGFLRYDCTAGRLDVLVMQGTVSGSAVPLLTGAGLVSGDNVGNAWATIDGGATKQYTDNTGAEPAGAQFAWVGKGYDATEPSYAQGYEASFLLAANPTTAYTIVVHVEALQGGTANTSAFAGFNSRVTSATVALDPVCSSGTATPTASSSGTPTASPSATATATPTPTVTATATPTPTPTPTPTATATPTPTPTPSAGGTGVDPSIIGNPANSDPALSTFTRTYTWSISKTADQDTITSPSSTAPAGYTVTVQPSGHADSHWAFAGTVAVSNPNSTDLTGVTVTDAVDNGGVCAVANGSGITIPANSSVTLHYTCTWSSAPSSASGTDTATSAWDPTVNNTPDGSATVDTPFTFATPTTRVAHSVSVVDSMAGTLGTLTASDSGTSPASTYHYTRDLAVPSSGCRGYVNTATLDATGQSASKTVSVCSGVAGISAPSAGAGLDRSLRVGLGLVLSGLLLVAAPRARRRRLSR